MEECLSCVLGNLGFCATAAKHTQNTEQFKCHKQKAKYKVKRLPGRKCLRNVSVQDSSAIISSKRKNKGSF